MARRRVIGLGEPEEVLLILEQEGLGCLVGIDEAGRGPLAGPVVAAAVCLPPGCRLPGVTDSKQLSPQRREECLHRILEAAQRVGVGIVSPEVIDRINVLQATYQAMGLALRQAFARRDREGDQTPSGIGWDPVEEALVLVDGRPVPGLGRRQVALVKGDRLSLCVAAASIVAKVTRDRLMREAHELYPNYGFADHQGYPTPGHLEALRCHGPCPLHRRTFGPVRALLADGERDLLRTEAKLSR